MKSVRKMVLVPYTKRLEKPQNKGLEKDLILSAMPKSLKRKADSLLQYIDSEVSWKENEEVVHKDKTLPGSHITDLVRYTLQEYGESPPPQYNAFLDILREANVPKSVVTQRKNPLPMREKKRSTWQKL